MIMVTRSIPRYVPSICCMVALLAGSAWAQSGTGSLTGNVVDENGKPVGGFTLILEPADKSSTRAQKIKVNKKGRFAHRFIPTSRYTVTVDGGGFLESMVYVIRDASNLQLDRIESKGHPERGLPPIQVLTGQNGSLDLVLASQEAQDQLSRQIALSESSGDLKKANDLLNAGKAEACIDKVDAVLAKKPDLGQALYLRGSALFRLKRFDEAEADLRKAIETIPDQPGIYATLADTRLAQADKLRKDAARAEEARAAFSEAADLYAKDLERQPGNEAALRQRVTALFIAERKDDLVPALEQLIAAVPADPEPYLQLARLATERGDHEGALAAMERIPEKGRETTTAMLNMAVGLYNESRYDEAEPIVLRALELDPEFAELHRLDAGIRLVRGDKAAAIAGLERYLELAPPDSPNVPQAKQLLAGLKAQG